jgi:hypothetical protein
MEFRALASSTAPAGEIAKRARDHDSPSVEGCCNQFVRVGFRNGWIIDDLERFGHYSVLSQQVLDNLHSQWEIGLGGCGSFFDEVPHDIRSPYGAEQPRT